ncbi:hypothetical protein C8F04DRAFT_1309798 [Mycena alexandri]|uniref:Uncharacterized protein n=1 Tax=Mycena alexandri TaxID=1745969 RepID=A0AAD6XAG5_9AGAR|nr:hypothetical protein C8F04DRAFT_1309798 [Mycena alexandri]
MEDIELDQIPPGIGRLGALQGFFKFLIESQQSSQIIVNPGSSITRECLSRETRSKAQQKFECNRACPSELHKLFNAPFPLALLIAPFNICGFTAHSPGDFKFGGPPGVSWFLAMGQVYDLNRQLSTSGFSVTAVPPALQVLATVPKFEKPEFETAAELCLAYQILGRTSAVLASLQTNCINVKARCSLQNICEESWNFLAANNERKLLTQWVRGLVPFLIQLEAFKLSKFSLFRGLEEFESFGRTQIECQQYLIRIHSFKPVSFEAANDKTEIKSEPNHRCSGSAITAVEFGWQCYHRCCRWVAVLSPLDLRSTAADLRSTAAELRSTAALAAAEGAAK